MAVVPGCSHPRLVIGCTNGNWTQGLFCGSLIHHQTPGFRGRTFLLVRADFLDHKFPVIQLRYANGLLSPKGLMIKHGLSIRQNDNQFKTGPGFKYSHLSASTYIMWMS
jgi:hypothetical protein